MAYSFVQVEQEKSRFILFLLGLLFLLYFFTGWAIWTAIKNSFLFDYYSSRYHQEAYVFYWPSLGENLVVFVFSLSAAITHFLVSINNLSARLMSIFGAGPLNLNYLPHKMFKNIIEEVGVALGGVKIRGCVINSAGLNAFSVSDYSGNSYIGVTEGLLTRLNREQLEAVIGHEAGHIASGDSLLMSISCSLFGLYETIFDMMTQGDETRLVVRNRPALLIIILIIIGIARFCNQIICTFISQEKEFRADAIAVRLTRNPLALAQSLYLISRSGWHLKFSSEDSLSSLCIVKPGDPSSVNQNSVFSTHPPIKERISILLNMAHTDIRTLDDSCKFKKPKIKVIPQGTKKDKKEVQKENSWFILNKDKWQGPFLLNELLNNKWFTPDHLVRREGVLTTLKASEDNELKDIFKPKKEEPAYKYSCPVCYQGLRALDYEGSEIYQCKYCKGVLVNYDDVKKILIRETMVFSPEIVAEAARVKSQTKQRFEKIKTINTPFLFNCPRCKGKMRRRLFNQYAPVEIDQCMWCGAVWFDHNELEIIQVIYDQMPDKEALLD